MKPTRPIEAIVERGRLRPLQHLPLAEHQHVWVTVVPVTRPRRSGSQLARLASKSRSFVFLADPAEEVYSLRDGQPV